MSFIYVPPPPGLHTTTTIAGYTFFTQGLQIAETGIIGIESGGDVPGRIQSGGGGIGVEISADGAGSGDDDIALQAVGKVRMGTHAGLAAEVLSGYITIKDITGTLRKIGVIS